MTKLDPNQIGSTHRDKFSTRGASFMLMACLVSVIGGPLAAFGGMGEPNRSGAGAGVQRDRSPATSRPAADEAMVVEDLFTSGGLLAAETVAERGSLSRAAEASGARFVDVSLSAAEGLRASRGPIELRNVPVGGDVTEDFLLTPFEVFSEDAEVFRMVDGQPVPAPRPDVRFFKGQGITNTSSNLLLSVADGRDVVMRVRSGSETMLIHPIPSETGEARHMMVAGSTVPSNPLGTLCSTVELPQYQQVLATMTEGNEPAALLTGELIEAEIMVDINYGLIANAFGGDANAASTYALNIVAASSVIYERDLSMRLKVSQLFYWEQQDPFSSAESSGQLQNYQQYCINTRGGYDRDVAVLMADLSGAGGIAYLGAFCDANNGYAVTNMEIDTTFPAQGYSWDLVVVSHELGHSFGSPHTHCYSPPIDCCYNECGCQVQPQTGTIMSYCHLVATIEPYFHSRVVNQIRGQVLNAACLTVVQGGGSDPGNGNCNGQQDDAYEPNDDWDQVTAIQPGEHQLQNCNIDLFSVDVPTDSRLTVTISGPQGDLDLFLFSAQEQLAASTTESSNESVQADVAAGTYYIDIEPFEGQGSAYALSLQVESLNGGSGKPDNGGPGNGGAGNSGQGNEETGGGTLSNQGTSETICVETCGACTPIPGAGLVAGMFFLGGAVRRRRCLNRLAQGREQRATGR